MSDCEAGTRVFELIIQLLVLSLPLLYRVLRRGPNVPEPKPDSFERAPKRPEPAVRPSASPPPRQGDDSPFTVVLSPQPEGLPPTVVIDYEADDYLDEDDGDYDDDDEADDEEEEPDRYAVVQYLGDSPVGTVAPRVLRSSTWAVSTATQHEPLSLLGDEDGGALWAEALVIGSSIGGPSRARGARPGRG